MTFYPCQNKWQKPPSKPSGQLRLCSLSSVPHGLSIHREPPGYSGLVWHIFGHCHYVEVLYYVTFKQERVCTSCNSFKRNYFCIDMLPRNSDCSMTQVCTSVRWTSELLYAPSFESSFPQELAYECTAHERRALTKKPFESEALHRLHCCGFHLCFALSKW